MDSNIYNLIRSSRTDDDGHYTHISYFGPYSRWNVKNEDLADFWRGYCRIVSEQKGVYPLAERVQDSCPVISRCTLHFDGQDSTEIYSENFILAVVSCYQRALMELFQIEDAGENGPLALTCAVLESDNDSIENGFITCRFTLQFPYCRTSVRDQQRILRPRVIQLLRTENVVSMLEKQPIHDWDTIIGNIVDSQGNIEPWLLYRGIQHQDHKELLLTHIYGQIDHDESDEEPIDYTLSEIFDPTHHSHVTTGLIPQSTFADDHDDVTFWLPMFLSVHFYQRLTLPVKTTESPSRRVTTITPTRPIRISSSVDVSEESDIQIAERLIDMLSRERVEVDHFWIDVGKALYNIHKGAQRGLDMWVRFTERYDNHTGEECETEYPRFSIGNNITLKTLGWYARIDSPEAYNQWHKAWCFPYLEKAVTAIHADVSAALYRIYWLDFVCSSLSSKLWYMFEEHRWKRLDCASNLKKIISGDFLKRFQKLRTETSMKIQESGDANWKASAEVMVKKLGVLIAKLGTQHYKSALVKEAQENFHDEKFSSKVDSSPSYMGVLNGVVEVCTGYACVRDGKPEDFVSKVAPVYWHPEYDRSSPMVRKTMKWIHQIFPDKALAAYAIRLFSSCLFGKNSNKILPVLTGDGDNSKSMLKKAFEATFGPYCVTLPTTILTAKRANSSAPCPELAQSKGAHMAFIQEPDGDDQMRAGTIKELTGGDTFFARFLHDDGGAVVASFVLFLMCNRVPIIPNSDRAVKNRLRILPFMSTWVLHANPSEEEQYKERRFQMDPLFELQIPAMAPALLWILVTTYGEYCTEGLNEPNIVSEYTSDYWAENDPYHQFITEYISPAYLPVPPNIPNVSDEDRERDPNAMLTAREIYSEYLPWFRESYPGQKVPSSAAVKAELINRWGRPTTRGWGGIRMNTTIVEL